MGRTPYPYFPGVSPILPHYPAWAFVSAVEELKRENRWRDSSSEQINSVADSVSVCLLTSIVVHLLTEQIA